ncbi:hypothetical protein THRCLA_05881 [Thraustotheca clavata]|uniref:Bromo domain-containing protein n=1 Tax=Thraustotheca clavata TaxID=74557 RepID=A0A1V9ZRR2_9STRA|nr:hypothetical protein THRCLA_05881 [Thraustotheca clavata]
MEISEGKMSTSPSSASREKERISQSAHDECMHVLTSLLQHEALRKATLTSAAKTALLEGTLDIQNAPPELRAKLSKKSMGLEKVQQLLGSKPSRCRFKTCEKFAKDVRVVFHNVLCWHNYWRDKQSSSYDAILYHTAQKMLQDFERMYKERLAQHISRAPMASPESNDSNNAPAAPVPVPQPPAPTPAPPPPTVSNTTAKLDDSDTQKCQAIVSKIMKYKELGVSVAAPFFNPVDCSLYVDYKLKIPHRMHLFGVQQKLSTGSYTTLSAFAYDMRLIFSNCLVYNSDVLLSTKIREHAVKLLQLFEQLMLQTFGPSRNTWPGLPETDRWKCHQIIHDILAHRTKQGAETAQWFKYPIKTYFESEDMVPYGYFTIVKKPMDIGTVSARLHLGEYSELSQFVSDLRRVFDNCIKYWKSNPDGRIYYDDGKTLLSLLKEKVNASFGPHHFEDKKKHHDHGSKSESKSSKSSSSHHHHHHEKSSRRAFPEKETCMAMIGLIKRHTMKGMMGEILTAGPFLHAVDVAKYPDYLTIITEPMDFAKIERKLKSNRYTHISEFTADVHLIFSNCMKYNSDPVEGADIRTMAANLRDYFIALYKAMENNEPLSSVPSTTSLTPPPAPPKSRKPTPTPPSVNESFVPQASPPPDVSSTTEALEKKKKREKKDKKEKKKKKDKKERKKEKKLPEQTTPAPLASPPAPAPTPTPPPPPPATPAPEAPPKAKKSSSSKPSKSKVKLDLSSWELSCERVLSRLVKIDSVQLMHFDVPLLNIFPDLAVSYKRVVFEPMDLGTMRQMLIDHAIPSSAEFVRLGNVVFDNAEKFNIGADSSSVRVREMAAHLRWLFDSLCIEHRLKDTGEGNNTRAERRNERFLAVQTLRFTESKPNKECNKVLKVLISQKYQKYSWPFVKPVEKLFPNLPPKYFEIITKPMDLQTISTKLNSLEYKTYGEFIADIRLTFENALLYNIADKGKEGPTVYNAGEKMLQVAMDLWGDVTIDIVERVKRSVLLHKEAQIIAEKNRVENEAAEAAAEADRIKAYAAKLEQQKLDEALEEERAEQERSMNQAAAAKAAKEARLSMVSMEKMSKSERKIEEKKRKKAKKDEELARSEKRRRTITLATEEALREAEERSRMRQHALDLLEEARQKQENLRLAMEQQKKHKRKATDNLLNGAKKPFWKQKRQVVPLAPCFSAT